MVLSISVKYDNGLLVRGATRGNGFVERMSPRISY